MSEYAQDSLFEPGRRMVHNPRDPALATAVTEDAIARVTVNADRDWVRAAREAGINAARFYPVLSADQVWEGLTDGEGNEWQPHEPRAMGAVMRWLAAQGFIAIIPHTTRPTERPSAHRSPCQLYRSLTYGR